MWNSMSKNDNREMRGIAPSRFGETIAARRARDQVPAGHDLFVGYTPTLAGARWNAVTILLSASPARAECK